MPEPNIGPPTHTPSSGPFITYTLEVAFVVLEDDDDLPYHLRCWRCAFLFVYWISACLYIGFLFVCLLGFGFGLTLHKAL